MSAEQLDLAALRKMLETDLRANEYACVVSCDELRALLNAAEERDRLAAELTGMTEACAHEQRRAEQAEAERDRLREAMALLLGSALAPAAEGREP
jgi:hypothetical protein